MYCKYCDKDKDNSCFSISYHHKGKAYYSTRCKECTAKYAREHQHEKSINRIKQIRNLSNCYVRETMKKQSIPTDNPELVELYKQNMKLRRIIYGKT